MEPLNYAFQFVQDIHIKITNPRGGTTKLRQDYYIKTHTINIYHKMRMIDII